MADEDFKRYTNLEQMNTEDLKSILRTAALTGEEIEPELMDRILEVIVKREENREENRIPDARQAREEFDQLYRNLKEPLYPIEPAEESSSQAQAPFQSASKRKLRHILRIVIVAAVLAVVMVLPVFGRESIFQIVAQWTAEQFSFRSTGALPAEEDEQSEAVPEEYTEFQAALLEYGIERAIVPRYIPEGFQAREPLLHNSPADGSIQFYVYYTKADQHIDFLALKDNGAAMPIFEKDSGSVEVYTISGVDHYLFSNSDTSSVAWYTDGITYSIGTNLAISELKQIIDSMY